MRVRPYETTSVLKKLVEHSSAWHAILTGNAPELTRIREEKRRAIHEGVDIGENIRAINRMVSTRGNVEAIRNAQKILMMKANKNAVLEKMRDRLSNTPDGKTEDGLTKSSLIERVERLYGTPLNDLLERQKHLLDNTIDQRVEVEIGYRGTTKTAPLPGGDFIFDPTESGMDGITATARIKVNRRGSHQQAMLERGMADDIVRRSEEPISKEDAMDKARERLARISRNVWRAMQWDFEASTGRLPAVDFSGDSAPRNAVKNQQRRRSVEQCD